MFNPKKIIENIKYFEKRFYEINPSGDFLVALVDFCHLLSPLWPSSVSAVISDRNKVITCLLGEHMKLAVAEGEDIDDQWQFKRVIIEDVMTEHSYRLYGHDFNQIITPLHDKAEAATGTFSCFYRTNWADFGSQTSDFKNEMVQAINSRMPSEIILRFVAEKMFHIADATHVLITERQDSDDLFFSISEFKKNANGRILENVSRRKLTTGQRIYGTILNAAQSYVQRSSEGVTAADSPFTEDKVIVFVVSPIITKDDIVGTLNVGFRDDAMIDRSTVNMIEETAGYVSICRTLDMLKINQSIKSKAAGETLCDPIAEGDSIKTSIELIFETKESLLKVLSRVYDMIDNSFDRASVEVFVPIINDLEQLGKTLIRYFDNDKSRFALQHQVNVKSILEELLFETDEKMLQHTVGEKRIGLINRMYADGVVEINTPSVKSIFARVIHSMIEHSATESNIFFETRREAGKISACISNYDPESLDFKVPSRNGPPEKMQLFFRLAQCLFDLNRIELLVNHPSDTQYRLEAVFKLADVASVPFPENQSSDVRALKEKHRILIVDDDDSLRDLMMDILESRNFSVACFGDAVSAIAAFRKNKFDLVITDFSLPGINGLELASQLKGITTTVPVILVSGWGSEMEKIKQQNPEIDCVLPKPFNLVDFLNMVENSIKPLKS